MQIKSTKDYHQNGVKILCYSFSGSGKTTLAATMPNPVILSAESGLLSLASFDLPYIQIETIKDLHDAYEWLTSTNEGRQFDSIVLDSISEIAEVVLSNEKSINKDGRAAFGATQEQMTELIRAFRDIPKHVYMTAKLEKTADELGKVLFSPSMPGVKMGQQLPYFFDEVLALQIKKDKEGQPYRVLMCDSDGIWSAKDRSGRLGQWFEPDLGKVIKAIQGESDEWIDDSDPAAAMSEVMGFKTQKGKK